ncbi:MerR family transcriptional regulator [Bacillus thuringiensis]|nr:MerR family transcriptional regulator [Bacillus thuringiensis]MED2784308.1 MerR family transcriptional regulator [Bacillus thuringiensis]
MTMSIKQVAGKLNIPISTICYYNQMGLFAFIKRDYNGYRYFTEEDLFWIDLITCMRSVGMSITTLQHIVNLYIQRPKTLPKIKFISHLLTELCFRMFFKEKVCLIKMKKSSK